MTAKAGVRYDQDPDGWPERVKQSRFGDRRIIWHLRPLRLIGIVKSMTGHLSSLDPVDAGRVVVEHGALISRRIRLEGRAECVEQPVVSRPQLLDREIGSVQAPP
jgi:hypothetical protein